LTGVFLLGMSWFKACRKKMSKYIKTIISWLKGTIFGCTHAGVTNCWVGVGSSGGPQSADLTVKQGCKNSSGFCYVIINYFSNF
jgi:hypothetical protein